MKKIIIGSYLIIASAILHAQKVEQLSKLFATDRAAGNQLGQAVAVNGNFAVIGASAVVGGDIQNSGECVYVFQKMDSIWTQKQKLVASDRAIGNDFGHSVSISGNSIIIGAPGVEGSSGAAYLFERNSSGTWEQVKKIVAPDKSGGDMFGSSVSISGKYAVVGAPNDADLGSLSSLTGAGSAYFLFRNNGNWEVLNKVAANDRSQGAGFGFSVAISGFAAVIGAPYEKRDSTGSNPFDAAGAAYVFELNANGKMQLVHKITDWSRAFMDYFGYSVAISGNTIMVGSPWEDQDLRMQDSVMNAGSVHVFEKKSDNRWWWTQKLIANDRHVADNFGQSVSISGNSAVIGAVSADESINSLFGTGAAYVFLYDGNLQGWTTKQMKIVAVDRAAQDWFGYSVAIDGDAILVGAPLQDRNNTRLIETDAGAAYIFGIGGCAPTSSHMFASACKSYTSPSKKHVWTQSDYYRDTILNKAGCDSVIIIELTITGKADTSVTVKGNTLTANAKNATYQWINCETNQPVNVSTRSLIATVNGKYKVTIDESGCVGTSSCHEVVVNKADSPVVTPPPAVITPPVVLPRNASTQRAFIEVNKIVAKDRTHSDGDEFGRSVGISGNYAVIGVPIEEEDAEEKNPVNGAGAIYIFKLDDGGKWKQLQKIVATDRGAGDNFGCSVGISGRYIVVGANRDHKNVSGIKDNHLSGSAYIIELNQNGTWYLTQKITADPDSRGGQEYFGTAVAVEGNTIVVSAPDHARDVTNSQASNVTATGALYVFDRIGGTWVQTQKLVSTDRELGSGLGNSVAICGDNIIGGAWGNDHDAMGGNRMDAAGAAYIFERKGGKWVQTQKLVADDRTPYDEFGFSVAISGDYAVVGARSVTNKRGDEDNELYAGNAYVFKRNAAGGWSQQMKINPDDRTQGDYLGTAVGISGDYLIVSAPGQDTDSLGNYMPNAGAIYVYYLDKSGNWVLSDKLSTFLKHQLDGFGHAVAISDCNIIGTSWVDQTDEEDKNEITNAGAASVFTAAGCANNGKCSGNLLPQDKTPRDKTQSASSGFNSFPQKAESADLKGSGNETSISNVNMGNEGITQPATIKNPSPKTDSVKMANSSFDARKVDMCIDRPQTGTLPLRPTDIAIPVIPLIKEDGTLGEVSSIKQSLAALSEKMWFPGDNITVGFVPSTYYKPLRDSIKKYVKTWEYVANIKFVFVDDVKDAQIKIAFDQNSATSWSKMGRDILYNPNNETTMLFGMVNTDVQLGYFRQRVLHEFGHALGFIHEHQSPAGGIPWDKEKAYAYFAKPPVNWSRAMVDENVFYKYSNSYTNSSVYDKTSIMHYYYPTELTTNNTSFKQNMKLSAIDSSYAREVYPFPPEPKNARGMLRTGDDCDEIVFTVDYNAQGVASYEVDFILEPGIDHHGNWITWWKKIGIPLKGGGEAGLEIQDKSVSNRKFNLSLIDKTRGITFSKAKFLGVHTLLNYKWDVLPAIIGGCRVRLTWRRDTCL